MEGSEEEEKNVLNISPVLTVVTTMVTLWSEQSVRTGTGSKSVMMRPVWQSSDQSTQTVLRACRVGVSEK